MTKNLEQVKKQFLKTGTVTMKIHVTDFSSGDLEELVEKVEDLARVDEIAFFEQKEPSGLEPGGSCRRS